MTEEIGNFHIKLSGEVDKNLGKSLEDNIGKSSSKIGENLTKNIEKALASPSFANFKNILSGAGDKIGGAVPSKSGGGGGGEGGASGGLAGMAAKIGILAGGVMLIVDALKGLAPIQAILKMLIAVIQITLYPIAQVLLAILKPIFVLLLKYVILPFYQKVMPVIEMVGKWLGETIAGILKDPVGAIQKLWGFVVEGTLKILGGVWEKLKEIWSGLVTTIVNIFVGIKSILGAEFKVIAGLLFDFGNFVVTIFTGLVQNSINVLTFFVKTIIGLLNLLIGPIVRFVIRVAKNPLDIFEALSDLGGELANTGERIGTFVDEVQTNWRELQQKTLNIITNIKDAGINIFTNFGQNMANLITITTDVIITTFGCMSERAVTTFPLITSAFNAMVTSMENRVQAQSTASGGVSYGTEQVPGWTSPTIRHAIAAQGSVRYANPMAEGGIVNKPIIAMIGERGPEAIIPLSKMGGIGTTVNNSFSITGNTFSQKSDIDYLVSEIKRAMRVDASRTGVF